MCKKKPNSSGHVSKALTPPPLKKPIAFLAEMTLKGREGGGFPIYNFANQN